MTINLRNRNFLAMKDFSEEEILYLIDLAQKFKDMKKNRIRHKYLEDSNIILLFEQASTRTRTSFEVAARDLGMGYTFINFKNTSLGDKESIEDSIRVFDRYYDGIVYRGHEQAMVEKLMNIANVPIYNALTDKWHPSQMISDMLTIREKFGHLQGLNLTYLGYTGDNTPNSLAITCAKLGINFTGAGPKKYFPKPDVIKMSEKFKKNHDSKVVYTEDVKKACQNADIIYTDMWIGLGEVDDVPISRIEALYPYRVNKEIMELTHDNSIFMHCLPAFHDQNSNLAKTVIKSLPGYMEKDGMEVSDEVFRSEKSKVFDQTENRIPAVKAILYSTLKYEDDPDII